MCRQVCTYPANELEQSAKVGDPDCLPACLPPQVTCKTGAMATNLKMQVPLIMRGACYGEEQGMDAWDREASTLKWNPALVGVRV